MIVTRHRQHAAERGSSLRIGVFEDIATAIYTGTLPVPHTEYPVEAGARKQRCLLAAPHGGGREVLVHAGLEMDIVPLEETLRAPELLVEAAQGRPAIPGNESCGVEARRRVQLALHQGESNQRLYSGQEYPTRLQVVFVLQGYVRVCESHLVFSEVCSREAASIGVRTRRLRKRSQANQMRNCMKPRGIASQRRNSKGPGMWADLQFSRFFPLNRIAV